MNTRSSRVVGLRRVNKGHGRTCNCLAPFRRNESGELTEGLAGNLVKTGRALSAKGHRRQRLNGADRAGEQARLPIALRGVALADGPVIFAQANRAGCCSTGHCPGAAQQATRSRYTSRRAVHFDLSQCGSGPRGDRNPWLLSCFDARPRVTAFRGGSPTRDHPTTARSMKPSNVTPAGACISSTRRTAE